MDVNQPYYYAERHEPRDPPADCRPLDAVGRVGAARLEYRIEQARRGRVNRVDHVETYGGTADTRGARHAKWLQHDQYQRLSPVSGRQYKGLRYGIAVTYGS